MTGSRALWVSTRKEARALWPAWAACAGALVAIAVAGISQFSDLGWFACFIASVAIAAQAIGHEYTHGTLPLLLSLPLDRRRLLLGKLLAVIPMLITLAALAILVLPGRRFMFDEDGEAAIAIASVLCALAAAPWLTMLCRSPLAGTVFAIAVLGQVHLLVNVIGSLKYGWGDGAPGKATLIAALLPWCLLGVTAFAVAASWRMFMRLEAGNGRYPTLPVPRWRRPAASAAEQAPARRRHPVWLLVKKELHLQQMSFAVTGVYAVLWLAFSLWATSPEDRGVLATIGGIYGAMLALLIGSLPSAEERQIGTLEWQALLPMAAWRQWIVKAGVALSLAVVLSFGPPLALAGSGFVFNPWYAAMAVFLTAGSLYVSSISDSAGRAFVVSTPAMLVVTLLVFRLGFGMATPPAIARTWVIFILIVLALWFAFENHRSAGRDLPRVGRQLLVMAAVPLLALIVRRF